MLPTEVKFPLRVRSCRKLPALGRCIGVKRSHDMLRNRSTVIFVPPYVPSLLLCACFKVVIWMFDWSVHTNFSLYWWNTLYKSLRRALSQTSNQVVSTVVFLELPENGWIWIYIVRTNMLSSVCYTRLHCGETKNLNQTANSTQYCWLFG